MKDPPAHHASRKQGAVKPKGTAIYDDEGNLLGGISGETYWNWLEIKDFYLPEDHRGCGLG